MIEQRTLLDPPEFRAAENGRSMTAAGVAMRYGARSKPLMAPGRKAPFVEQFKPGSLTKTLSERDITANHEHDRKLYLGRTAAGTLRFDDSPSELRYEITLPDTAAGRDVANLAERGDLKGSSVGFLALPQATTWSTDESGLALRTVGEAALDHLATTCYPAYDDSTLELALRSLAADLDYDLRALIEVAERGELASVLDQDQEQRGTAEEIDDDGRETTVTRQRISSLMY